MSNSLNSPSQATPVGGSPRILEEGRPNFERNNRTSDWFGHSTEIIDVVPESRLKFEAARAKALQSQESSKREQQSEQFNSNNNHAENGRPESCQESSDISNGEIVNDLTESYAGLEVSSNAVVRVEGEGHQEREPVTSNGQINHTSAAASPNSGKVPALKLESGRGKKVDQNRREVPTRPETARVSKQGRLHQESASSGWDPVPPHRLRADGEGIAKKNKTDSVSEIFLQSSNNSQPRIVKEPKIPKNLAEDTTPQKPATPRVRSEGLQNMQKAMNHSEMSAIMHGSPVESAPPRPNTGRKMLPHMQRSELW